MIQEGDEILLHLNGVVLGLSHSEDPHPALPPSPVLLQEEGQQHEESSIMNNPPDVDVSLKFGQILIDFLILMQQCDSKFG